MPWTVDLAKKVAKQWEKLPNSVKDAVALLVAEMRTAGPVRGNWSNYSKLPGSRHHCHLKKGKPSYVAVWREEPGAIKLIEVIYVGTHEKAPY